MPNPRHEVIWDGSKDFNRGYLGCVGDPVKPAPGVRPSMTVHRMPFALAKELVRACLVERPHSIPELQQKTRCSESSIGNVLTVLRRRGVLKSEPNPEARYGSGMSKRYWIE